MKSILITAFGFVFWATPIGAADITNFRVMTSVTQDREVYAKAKLDGKKYDFHTAMQVSASLERTKKILTDYPLYKKLVPLVDRSDYSPATKLLWLEGGVLGYLLSSKILMTDLRLEAMRFEIKEGHFQGLKGEIHLEKLKDRGTLVFMTGWIEGGEFPPKYVIEHGAAFALTYAGRKMRAYIESPEN